MQNDQKNNFISVIPFNHPVFEEIAIKIKSLLENEPDSIGRRFQIRSLLYVTFNTYITQLILNLTEENGLNFIDELEGVDDETELLEKIGTKFNKSSEELINNYLQLFRESSK